MQAHNLHTVEPSLPAIHSSLQNHLLLKTNQNSTYYKALRSLKQVTQKLYAVKNRIKLLTEKEYQAQHPISQYYQQRGILMRNMASQYNKKSIQELQVIRDKSISQISLKRIKNESNKQENHHRINKARRIATQQKFKSHDIIRQKSVQNMRKIQEWKVFSLIQKQEKNRQMLERSRKNQLHLRQLQESRISMIKDEFEIQTKKILKKLKEKEAELQEKESQCQIQEAHIKSIIFHKKRKMKKIHLSHKPITVQTRSSLIFGKEFSSTPRSPISFVIIP